MNSNLRKTVLLLGLFTSVGMMNPLQAMATPEGNSTEALQQAKKITGNVKDSQGPLIGATIMEKGTTNGAVTDIEGNFSLNVNPGAILVISYVGYVDQEIKVGSASDFNERHSATLTQ